MTIKLSAEVEERIRERVAAGEAATVGAYVEDALRSNLGLAAPDPSVAAEKSPEELEKEAVDFFAAIDALLPPDTPALPDQALRRESIYDHLG